MASKYNISELLTEAPYSFFDSFILFIYIIVYKNTKPIKYLHKPFRILYGRFFYVNQKDRI